VLYHLPTSGISRRLQNSPLTDAVESPGASYRYAYDLASNRIDVWTNGTLTSQQDCNAANQVVGWSYDNEGNLLCDGTTTYGPISFCQLNEVSHVIRNMANNRMYAPGGNSRQLRECW